MQRRRTLFVGMVHPASCRRMSDAHNGVNVAAPCESFEGTLFASSATAIKWDPTPSNRLTPSFHGAVMNPVDKALWFIESHFTDELPLDEIAKVAVCLVITCRARSELPWVFRCSVTSVAGA